MAIKVSTIISCICYILIVIIAQWWIDLFKDNQWHSDSILISTDAQGQCWFQELRIFGEGGKIPQDMHEKFCDQNIWVNTSVKVL